MGVPRQPQQMYLYMGKSLYIVFQIDLVIRNQYPAIMTEQAFLIKDLSCSERFLFILKESRMNFDFQSRERKPAVFVAQLTHDSHLCFLCFVCGGPPPIFATPPALSKNCKLCQSARVANANDGFASPRVLPAI